MRSVPWVHHGYHMHSSICTLTRTAWRAGLMGATVQNAVDMGARLYEPSSFTELISVGNGC
jgi:hypothetical protein